jgi:hypothetical protein
MYSATLVLHLTASNLHLVSLPGCGCPPAIAVQTLQCRGYGVWDGRVPCIRFDYRVCGFLCVHACRYSAAAAARLIQQHQVTALIAVPTMITDLVQHQQQHQQQALEPPSVARVSGPQHPSLGASSSSSSRAGLKGTANNRNHVQSAAAAAATGSRLVPLPSVQRLLVGAGGMTPSVQVCGGGERRGPVQCRLGVCAAHHIS